MTYIPNSQFFFYDFRKDIRLYTNPNATASGIEKIEKRHDLYAIHVHRGTINSILEETNTTKYGTDTLLAYLIKNNCAPVYERKLICPKASDTSSCFIRFNPSYWPSTNNTA